jgi:hypothetical protein
VSGTSFPNDFPVVEGPGTGPLGGSDAFVAKLFADGSGLDYVGLLGGEDFDNGRGIAVDSLGNAYVTGGVAPGPGSYPDAFVAKIADGDPDPTDPPPSTDPGDVPYPPPVHVDLKPGSNPNCVNPRSKGNVAVAVFGSETLNVANIVQSTVVFGGAAPLRCSFQDVLKEGDTLPDGIPDLICHFDTLVVRWPGAGTDCAIVPLSFRRTDNMTMSGGDVACLAGELTCATAP